MPRLRTFDQLAAHLAEALNGRSRWVLLTDAEGYHGHLSRFAAELRAAGVPAAAMRYGCFGWTDAEGLTSGVSVLLVAKADCPAERVAAFLARHRHPPMGLDQDVVVVSADPARLAGLLALARDGRLRPAGDPAAN